MSSPATPTAPSGMPRTRVLVVDDSAVIRRLVTTALAADPAIEVVGSAADGRAALAAVDRLAPDVITMDIEMPVMDGIAAVRALRARGVKTPVIMFSTLTERGALATLDALAAGASDYVTKPAQTGGLAESLAQVRDQLVPRIAVLAPRTAPTLTAPATAAPSPAPPSTRPRRSSIRPYRLLVVGCSTGGPDALPTLLAALPATVPVPILVVQHMPPVFTTHFAARLDRHLPLRVVEATDDTVLVPGTVYLAPGDRHLEVARHGSQARARLHQGPAEHYCRPAVDVLFRSAAASHGPDTLAVVLTGMGSDGRHGAQHLVNAGGSVLVQDRATSVVWGMPGAVAGAGLAEEVLPLPTLATTVRDRLAPTGGAR